MRIFTLIRFSAVTLLTGFLFSCNEKEEFVTESLPDYVPLAPGKYITYRVDSTVFPNFGRAVDTHYYRVKHVVDALVTDNLGRPSYRIYRYISDSSGTTPWMANGSYFITVLNDQMEEIDDNLRWIKLHAPLRGGFSWKGNRYLPDQAYSPLYLFNNDYAMDDWDYYYEGDPQTELIGNRQLDDVFTVQSIDESENIPWNHDSVYAARTFLREKYAKGIGLVYREYIMWDREPNRKVVSVGPPPVFAWDPYRTGWGLKMWMVEHN